MARNITRVADKFKNALGNHNIPGLRFLIDGFNFYDRSRVKDVGPDRAAAEWIVRCGGIVKFDKFKDHIDDYNTLIRLTAELDPAKPSDRVKLLEIDASNSSVSGFGCRHFTDVNSVQSLAFINCKSFNDIGIETLAEHIGHYLPYLHIENCPKITEYGLEHLSSFKNLKSLILSDLRRVHHPDRTLTQLKKSLPNCDITFKF